MNAYLNKEIGSCTKDSDEIDKGTGLRGHVQELLMMVPRIMHNHNQFDVYSCNYDRCKNRIRKKYRYARVNGDGSVAVGKQGKTRLNRKQPQPERNMEAGRDGVHMWPYVNVCDECNPGTESIPVGRWAHACSEPAHGQYNWRQS